MIVGVTATAWIHAALLRLESGRFRNFSPQHGIGAQKFGRCFDRSAFCAIAETGTLVVLSGAQSPTATTLLPDTHIAVLSADRIVAGMEEAFALIRRERGSVPRAINLISGPSRTGDIEQTIVLGAHGPYRVHILLVGA